LPIVGVAKLAAALNVDERRVQQLVHEGLPHESHGRYDLVKCMLFYIRYLQNALAKKCVPGPDGTYLSEREERVRLIRAKTDLKELLLAEKRHELVSRSDLERNLSDLVVDTRNQLMLVPARVVARLSCECNRHLLRELMEKNVKDALVVLSQRVDVLRRDTNIV
jgi:phage terminase Nu1 subunit (DNA packaging protein)